MQVTGSATISSLGTGFNGCRREVRFAAACTLVNSANLVLPRATNYVTTGGDVLAFRCIGSGQWALVSASRAADAALLGGVAPSAYILTLLDDVDAATARGTLGAVNKAGDTMTGALAVPALNASASTQGFQMVWNTVSAGTGRTEYINNHGGGAGGFTWYDRVDTSVGTGSALMILDTSGTLSVGGSFVAAGGITVGGGFTIKKVTVSSAAPGALADGEVWFQY